ncbi:hypothetical protein H5410_036392 [Solanum commersonii]|uniref:Uncharacterized protein n=1 Tax=Solanum commersonii TaxID=4109 RepID=A0A9J5Y6D3_SOLCO|nr:hypothetical protein H5410_036392 [Solanum commersonii]
MNCLISGLHYMDITRDKVCLVYALMMPIEWTIGAVMKSVMRKARVHKGRRCSKRELGLYGTFFPSTCGHHEDKEARHTLTTKCHAKALLGIDLEFREPVDNDISIDEERLCTSSDVESDYDKKGDLAQANDEVKGGDAMED